MSGGAPEMLTSSIGDYETQLTLHTPCKGSYKLTDKELVEEIHER